MRDPASLPDDASSQDPSPQLDAFAVDLRDVLDRNVASLYSHLVTRPTGRAVRLAIESQLKELGLPALSLVDLSSVSILDYSCADEVVAKLLLARRSPSAPHREVFFVFHGLRDHHREPILEVLERHRLAAVTRAHDAERDFELLGTVAAEEARAWARLQALRRVPALRIEDAFPDPSERRTLEGLVQRGLIFRHPLRGDLHALSSLL